MIRKPKIENTCCPTCKRAGFLQVESFCLMTEDEQRDCFKGKLAHGIERDLIGKVPYNAEKCYVTGAASVDRCITEGIDLARRLGRPVAFEFNTKIVICREDDDMMALYRKWYGKALYGDRS